MPLDQGMLGSSGRTSLPPAEETAAEGRANECFLSDVSRMPGGCECGAQQDASREIFNAPGYNFVPTNILAFGPENEGKKRVNSH